MPRSIILIRHAESNANAARRWQGTLDSGISPTGLDQIAHLGKRFVGSPHTTLIASDLARTQATAGAIGTPELDPRWREFSVGDWEGLTHAEVEERFPGHMAALFRGEDFPIGGAERLSEFNERIAGALQATIDRTDEGETTVVVTHGGAIWSVVSQVLGRVQSMTPVTSPYNTSLTRLRIEDDGSIQLVMFNDATHLPTATDHFGPDGTTVTLMRHGQTEGNVVGRWQGRSDSDLTDLGREQAEAASAYVPSFDAVFTSPLGRTRETARILARDGAVPEPVPFDGLLEMSFGDWENMTLAEAKASDPDLFERIYIEGNDEPRGRTGESFTQAGQRVSEAVAELATNGHGSEIGAISHGAAIRSYVTTVLGLEFAERNVIPIPRNTSMSRVIYTEDVSVLGSYNVAPHLD